MELVKRALAVLLVATAVAVAANLILTPVYHDGAADYPVWKVINWFMAASTIVALGWVMLRRHAGGPAEGGDLEGVKLTILYYGAIVLTMLFFWGWFWTLNPDSETGDAVTSHIIHFPAVDALFVLVALGVGRRLWNEGSA